MADPDPIPFPRGKRGDIAVVEQTRYFTTVDLKTKPYRRWYLVKITSTRRDGLVKGYVTTDGTPHAVRPGDNVHVINQPDKQAAARQAFSSYTGIAVWTTLIAIKKAILKHLERCNDPHITPSA